jgi:hypothetical protein
MGFIGIECEYQRDAMEYHNYGVMGLFEHGICPNLWPPCLNRESGRKIHWNWVCPIFRQSETYLRVN